MTHLKETADRTLQRCSMPQLLALQQLTTTWGRADSLPKKTLYALCTRELVERDQQQLCYRLTELGDWVAKLAVSRRLISD